ncbi:MAG: DNA repair protein RadA, partial [Deltaproteobacteria bacterium]|nr:DNA repair protein RadA [Deltaproteobacteria bacterium]
LVEPAADLGLMAAIASSAYDCAADQGAVFVGEVGLTGEVRGVSRLEIRLREAEKLGFTKAFLPKNEARRLKTVVGLELIGVATVGELLGWLKK